jgi:hypothetical protein
MNKFLPTLSISLVLILTTCNATTLTQQYSPQALSCAKQDKALDMDQLPKIICVDINIKPNPDLREFWIEDEE